MLKFIVDTQLPPALANKLLIAGFDAIHTTSFENGQLLNDKQIREIAVNENRNIVTKDSDFFDYFILRNAPPRILFLKLGNISNPKLFSVMDANINQVKNLFESENISLVILQEKNTLVY